MTAGQGGRHYERLLATKINFFAYKNNLDVHCPEPAGSNKLAKDLEISCSNPLTIEIKNTIKQRGEFGQFRISWTPEGWILKSGKNIELANKILLSIKNSLPSAYDFDKLTFEVVNELHQRWKGTKIKNGNYGGFDVMLVSAEEVGLNSAKIIQDYYKGNDGIQIYGFGLYGLTDRVPTCFSEANPEVMIKFRVKYHGGFKKGKPQYSFTVVPIVKNLNKSSLDLESEETLKKLFMEET